MADLRKTGGLIGLVEEIETNRRCTDEYLSWIKSQFSHELESSSLYKYMDFEGGIQALKNHNLQFNCPLKFRQGLGRRSDPTELSQHRFFVDHLTHEWLIKYFKKYDFYRAEMELPSATLGYLLFSYFRNYVQRTGVACLSMTNNNSELWKDNPTGICIEYSAKMLDLFSDSGICAKVAYTDNIQMVNFRYVSDPEFYNYLIFNQLFVKETKYAKEDEFRIVRTLNIPDAELLDLNVDDLIDNKLCQSVVGRLKYERVEIPSQLIKKVYYTEQVEDQGRLFELLDQIQVPHQKLSSSDLN